MLVTVSHDEQARACVVGDGVCGLRKMAGVAHSTMIIGRVVSGATSSFTTRLALPPSPSLAYTLEKAGPSLVPLWTPASATWPNCRNRCGAVASRPRRAGCAHVLPISAEERESVNLENAEGSQNAVASSTQTYSSSAI